MKKNLVLFFIICCLPLSALADSIWNQGAASPYSTDKAYKVGDIINILVVEASSAQNKAGTDTNIRDDLAFKLTNTVQRLAPVIGTNSQIDGQLSNKYTASGKTTRGNDVKARISAWVTEVLPNGNVQIQGRHRVQINEETQDITITGTVRPKDISGANTIYSYQVANAEITMKGTGSVAEAQSPGFLTRLFNWLF